MTGVKERVPGWKVGIPALSSGTEEQSGICSKI